MKRVFVSDCEGPISKNDNAFEITAHFVPNGSKLFTIVSKYDDVLADVLKKPDYTAGSTLKLILPFLKAYDVKDAQMEEFSAQNLILIANSKNTLQHVKTVASAFIVSTSYEHYIKALCKALDFPYENTYCTKLSIDKYTVAEQEKARLKEISEEIVQMPMITIPPEAKTLEDFSSVDQETIKRLDTIFWSAIEGMSVGRIFSEVTTVGGSQKAASIEDAVAKLHVPLEDVMYVGDSITDAEAFKLVRENGGLTVSFNGNSYAVKNAEVSVLSENNAVTAVIADVFCKQGKQAAWTLVENWNLQSLESNRVVSPSLLDRLFSLHPQTLPKVQIVTAKNMETVTKKSSEFRKKVRGEAIGKLG
ncbi:HAD hydrolase family protein [Candidatus Bathyarchaeota archaeon]|nr:HAD hydrolase family protein [Candidatus Bathyarchaeota archaeon]